MSFERIRLGKLNSEQFAFEDIPIVLLQIEPSLSRWFEDFLCGVRGGGRKWGLRER